MQLALYSILFLCFFSIEAISQVSQSISGCNIGNKGEIEGGSVGSTCQNIINNYISGDKKSSADYLSLCLDVINDDKKPCLMAFQNIYNTKKLCIKANTNKSNYSPQIRFSIIHNTCSNYISASSSIDSLLKHYIAKCIEIDEVIRSSFSNECHAMRIQALLIGQSFSSYEISIQDNLN